MRALVVPFVAALLFTGCATQPPVSPQAVQSGEPSNDFWRRVEAMAALEQEAEVVLEAEAVDRFRLVKPAAVAEESAIGLDGYLRLIPPRTKSGSGLVVLIIPETERVQGTQKIMDEVILDVRDAAMERGCQRYVVGAHSHGFAVQIYSDGLLSRQQVAEKKRSWKETAEKFDEEPGL